MIQIMGWQQCEREFIRTVEKDHDKILSLAETARKRLKLVKEIPVTNDTVSFVVEGYYEVIKELLVAYLLKNGLRSKNHQCLISYFYMKHKEYEYEARIISQLSYYRNRLDYYGELIPQGFYDQYKKVIPEIIALLFEFVGKK